MLIELLRDYLSICVYTFFISLILLHFIFKTYFFANFVIILLFSTLYVSISVCYDVRSPGAFSGGGLFWGKIGLWAIESFRRCPIKISVQYLSVSTYCLDLPIHKLCKTLLSVFTDIRIFCSLGSALQIN